MQLVSYQETPEKESYSQRILIFINWTVLEEIKNPNFSDHWIFF